MAASCLISAGLCLLYYLGQVGAVVVKGGKVVGRGWNRMPLGCETRFSWQRDKDKPIEEGKHYYGMIIIS